MAVFRRYSFVACPVHASGLEAMTQFISRSQKYTVSWVMLGIMQDKNLMVLKCL